MGKGVRKRERKREKRRKKRKREQNRRETRISDEARRATITPLRWFFSHLPSTTRPRITAATPERAYSFTSVAPGVSTRQHVALGVSARGFGRVLRIQYTFSNSPSFFLFLSLSVLFEQLSLASLVSLFFNRRSSHPRAALINLLENLRWDPPTRVSDFSFPLRR